MENSTRRTKYVISFGHTKKSKFSMENGSGPNGIFHAKHRKILLELKQLSKILSQERVLHTQVGIFFLLE